MAVNTSFLILTFIEIFVYLFHFSVLILMFVKRHTAFKGPFFNIFRIVLIGDLICYITIIVTQKLALISSLNHFYSNHHLFNTIFSNILNYTYLLQFYEHLIMAFNRFTIIWFPINHEYIWRKQWYTILLIITPFLNATWRLTEPIIYVFASDNSSFYVTFVNINISSIHNALTTIIFFTVTCFAAIFNILAFAKFFMKKQNNSYIKVHDRILLFVSLVIFISQLFRCSYNFGRLVFGSNPEILTFLTMLNPFLNDIFAWSGSISLMLLSSSVRKEYLSFYLCRSDVKLIYPTHLGVILYILEAGNEGSRCAAERQLDIINYSIASFAGDEEIMKIIREMVNLHNILLFKGSGNNGPFYSSCIDSDEKVEDVIFTIGAVLTPKMRKQLYNVSNVDKSCLPVVYPFLSRGPGASSNQGLDFVTPGATIARTPRFAAKKYMDYRGTSFASPNAAGAVACLLSGLKAKKIQYSPKTIKFVLAKTANLPKNGNKFEFGHGIIQIR